MKRFGITFMLVFACGGTTLATTPRSVAHAATPELQGADYNGDGYADVAISTPNKTISGVKNAGAVHVLYGSKNGLRTDNEQYLHEAAPGINGDPSTDDRFGMAFAHGDLNDDGFDDLAIGMPFQNLPGAEGAGGVHVLYGSKNGLGGDKYFDQSTPGVYGTVGTSHRLGTALAIGDYDGDGVDDLAVGAPWDTGGTVMILRGNTDGYLHPWTYWGSPDAKYGSFGARLAAGDFDGNGADELAVAETHAQVGPHLYAGRVHVYRITSTQVLFDVSLDHANLPGDAHKSDLLGISGISAGRIGDDKYDDLAIGTAAYDVGDKSDVGEVVVVRGSAQGLDPTKSKQLVPGQGGVPGSANAHAGFGSSPVISDANGDGRGDLAVSLYRAVSGKVSVLVLRGGAANVTTANAKVLTEQSLGLPNTPNSGFGLVLAWSDTNGDGNASLLIDSPFQIVNNADYAGAVTVVPWPLNAKPTTGVKVINEATAGIAGTPTDFAMFGDVLS